MSNDFPWSVLELPGQASETEIRRAYARKLKTTKPQDDPEGFQALVAARDFALILAGLPAMEEQDAETRTSQGHTTDAPISSLDEKQEVEALGELEAFQPLDDEMLLWGYLQQAPKVADHEVWQNIAALVPNLPLIGRQRVEPALLQLLASFNPREIFQDKTLRKVLLTLSEEFGWEDDGVKLAAMLVSHERAIVFEELLYAIRFGYISLETRRSSRPQEANYEPQQTHNKSVPFWVFFVLIIFAISRCSQSRPPKVPEIPRNIDFKFDLKDIKAPVPSINPNSLPKPRQPNG